MLVRPLSYWSKKEVMSASLEENKQTRDYNNAQEGSGHISFENIVIRFVTPIFLGTLLPSALAGPAPVYLGMRRATGLSTADTSRDKAILRIQTNCFKIVFKIILKPDALNLKVNCKIDWEIPCVLQYTLVLWWALALGCFTSHSCQLFHFQYVFVCISTSNMYFICHEWYVLMPVLQFHLNCTVVAQSHFDYTQECKHLSTTVACFFSSLSMLL